MSDPVAPPASESDLDAARAFFKAALAAESDKQRARGKTRSRVFSVLQYEVNPVTGERLFAEELLRAGLIGRGSIRRWAYIRHDRDRLTEVEATNARERGHAAAAAGDLKPPHFHAVLECEDAYSIAQIANWVGVPAARIRVPKEIGDGYAGAGARERAYYDLVSYLVHENVSASSKLRYDRAEVVTDSADLWGDFDTHMAARATRGRSGGSGSGGKKLDALMLRVMQGEMTLREVRAEDPVLYGRNIEKFKRWRADYLTAKVPPRVRVNHYIGGALGEQQLGRTGKSVLARLLAVALYPELDPEECYFEATDKRAPLQNYAGQPVIIWDDFLPVELLEALGGRGGVLKAFDVHPGRLDANIKNSVAALRHEVNILTRAMHYGRYIDALAGSYTGRDGTEHQAEAPEQFWGRFTFAHEVTPDDISVLVSRAAVEGTQEFRDFQKVMGLRVGMRGLVQALDTIEDPAEKQAAHLEVGRRVLGPVLDRQAAICAPGTRTKEAVLAELNRPDFRSYRVNRPGSDGGSGYLISARAWLPCSVA